MYCTMGSPVGSVKRVIRLGMNTSHQRLCLRKRHLPSTPGSASEFSRRGKHCRQPQLSPAINQLLHDLLQQQWVSRQNELGDIFAGV